MVDQNYWRQKLETFRQELLDIDAEAKESRQTVELDQTRVGRLSRMNALQGQAMNNAIAERRRQTLAKIDAAFIRLDADEFGYCLACGDEIFSARLELDPTTSFCTTCVK